MRFVDRKVMHTVNAVLFSDDCWMGRSKLCKR
jgi:hypothetical protein